MGALPKPNLPDGPVRALFDELHALHHLAGWPSLRDMAKEVGCSHTTISAAFSEPRVPRWGLLELIVEELGGDTAQFHDRWLAASAGTPSPVVAEVAASTAQEPVPPRELPADIAGFTGRADELAELDRLLGTNDPGEMSIVVVSGTAGVGKTALAVRWAQRVADTFPDGQLYVNLRGYDPDRPVTSAEALEGFLAALGIAGTAMPQDQAKRAARFRTLLAGRRMLVLLDNAESVEQVRDLLPGTPTCFVLVTSRDTLPGLVARHGAVRINLDLLSPGEALALLRRLVGARVDADPQQAEALARRCARLPLALRIAAELAAARPRATLAGLVAELASESSRLDILNAGDDEFTAVRTVFSWSIRNLDPAVALAFRLLGLPPGLDIDGFAAAALTGTDVDRAHRLLNALTRAHLLDEAEHGRFAMHDLLHAYAIEQAAELAEPERQAAFTQICDYYLAAAEIATTLAFPNRAPTAAPPVAALPPLSKPAEARGWLDLERPNLLAVAARSPAHAGRMSVTLAAYLDSGGHYADALTLHQQALAAANGAPAAAATARNQLAAILRRLGRYTEARGEHALALAEHRETADRLGEADALHGLGVIGWRSGRYAEARQDLEDALLIYRELGDRAGEGRARHSLGVVCRRLGRLAEAAEHYAASLIIHRETGDRIGQGHTFNNLGIVHLRLGNYDEAADLYANALEIYRELDNRVGEAVAMTNLGSTYHALGRSGDALELHRRALTICLEVGYRVGQADALRGVGADLAGLGDYDEAVSSLTDAVDLGREIGDADALLGALNDLGTALTLAGRDDEASARFEAALAMGGDTGDRYEQARAIDGLAQLLHNAGKLSTARERWAAALELYQELGVPEAAAVAERLAAAPLP